MTGPGVGKPGRRPNSDASKGGNVSDANTSGKETDSRSSTPSLQGKDQRSTVVSYLCYVNCSAKYLISIRN